MRFWHEALIPYLPRQQLLGLHREVCALRGNDWGKKHATVDYVFRHPYGWLVAYHFHVMDEMAKRGYQPDHRWWDRGYCGEKAPHLDDEETEKAIENFSYVYSGKPDRKYTIYPEHNDAYLQKCLENLAGKGIHIDTEGER